MKNFSFVVFIFLILTISIPKLYAVSATPYPITITQADGSEITIKLYGDEFFHYKTSLDGYTLVSDTDGALTYATLDMNGKLTSTHVKVHNVENRSLNEKKFIQGLTPNMNFSKQNIINRSLRAPSASLNAAFKIGFPLTGTPKSLVILVNFSDKSFVVPSPGIGYTNLLNETGYNANGGTGSAKDYFKANSMGVFTPEFDVVGPFTLPQTLDYYGKNDASGNDINPQQMVIDACALASQNGVDFSQYDTNNDGYVDNVFIYYAGYNEAEGGPANTVWPHRWTLANSNTKFNGKIIYDYACTSELRSNSGSSMCGIGTFSHEFGHVLGLDDLYATSGATHHTMSYWDIMDSGPYLNSGRTPPAYSSYERFFLTWLVPTEIKTPQNITLDTLTTSNKAYLITQNGNHNLSGSSPSPVEFFMLENRQRKGWDAFLPGHGMLITHVYYNSSTWANNTPNDDPNAMGVDIVEADDIATDASLAGDPFPGTSGITSYSPVLRAGTNIGKPLTFITEENGIIKFKFMGGAYLPTISTNGKLSSFSTVQGTPSDSQLVYVSAERLVSDVQLTFENKLHYFQMKRETDTVWTDSLSLTPINSVVNNLKIYIRYNPAVPSFRDIHSDSLVLESTNAENIVVSLTGTSTRAVYVKPPTATEASEISISSFIANWDSVFDASGYYLTVYNVSEGESEFTEGFDNGLVAPLGWIINAGALTTSISYSGKLIPAIQFKNSGEFIMTENYILPIKSISFYTRSLAEVNGKLLVEAWNGTSWNTVDSIPVNSSLNGINNYSFNTENNYTRFRFTFTKGNGSVAIDDITVALFQNLEFNAREKWVTSTSDTLMNLVANRDYFYKVRGSDKTLYPDSTIKYENITDFSNLVQLKTLEDKSGVNGLIAFVDTTNIVAVVNNVGTVTVILPSTDVLLNVYNIVGQRVRTIKPTYNVVSIRDLPKGQAYILQAGKRRTKIVL